MTLWYLPIEPYEERYTRQLDDWVTAKIEEKGIESEKITGKTKVEGVQRGQVLDAIGRPIWCIEQAKQLLEALADNRMKSGDNIFTMDVWQFGIETIAYASNLMNQKINFYGFNCGGSFEWYDFINLTGIVKWGKHLERAWFEWATKVFFASEKLRELALRSHMFSDPTKAVLTGLAFNSEYVLNEVGLKDNGQAFYGAKKDTVVFPHRFDMEKKPNIYCDVIEKLSERRKDIKFILTTGRKGLTGTADNSKALRLEKEGKLQILAGMPKRDYYSVLLNSRIIFSSAKQDTVGNCILESITLGCTPVVNTGVSYGEFLPRKFIYTDGCVDEACELIEKYIDEPVNAFSYIKRYDKSIDNMLKEMGY